MTHRVFPIVFGLALTAASAQAQVPIPAPAPATSAPSPDYRLETGDAIDVRFFYNQELNESMQIRPDGFISMPLLGDVRASGHTTASLADDLGARYRDIVKQPAVSVQVRSFANRRVFVTGEVARPGVLPLVGVQTALGAIAEAGGMTSRAKRGQIVLIRRGASGAPELYGVSMKETNGQAPEAANVQLRPLDVVIVSESGVAKANRVVDQYVRQMIPALLTVGFTYLANATVLGVDE